MSIPPKKNGLVWWLGGEWFPTYPTVFRSAVAAIEGRWLLHSGSCDCFTGCCNGQCIPPPPTNEHAKQHRPLFLNCTSQSFKSQVFFVEGNKNNHNSIKRSGHSLFASFLETGSQLGHLYKIHPSLTSRGNTRDIGGLAPSPDLALQAVPQVALAIGALTSNEAGVVQRNRPRWVLRKLVRVVRGAGQGGQVLVRLCSRCLFGAAVLVLFGCWCCLYALGAVPQVA